MKIIIPALFLTLLNTSYATNHMQQVRYHLDQANTSLWKATESEAKQWGHWLRKSREDNKKYARQWLKERAEHL